MRFEETNLLVLKQKKSEKTEKMAEMLNDFLKSGIKVAEIKDWEDDYSRADLARLGLDYVIRSRSISGVHTSVSNGHIYIARLEK